MMINDNHDQSNEQPSNSSSFSPLPLFFKEKKNRFKAFIHRTKNSKDLTNSSRSWNQILVDNRSTHNLFTKYWLKLWVQCLYLLDHLTFWWEIMKLWCVPIFVCRCLRTHKTTQ